MKNYIGLVLISGALAGIGLYSVAEAKNFQEEDVILSEDFSFMVESVDLVTPQKEVRSSAKPEDVYRANVVAIINKSSIGSTAQTMRVYVDGNLTYTWKISTGREKEEKAKSGRVYVTTTPVGYFRPYELYRNYHSTTWDADMPNAVFFKGKVATHATPHIDELGTRASGGCIRNTPENAKIFYNLVKGAGKKPVEVINRNGSVAKNKDGTPVLQVQYDALIIVENSI